MSPVILAEEGVTIITFSKEAEILDESKLDQMRDRMLEAAQEAVPPLVVLDMSPVNFFGSSFIEMMFRLGKLVESRQGKFALCGLTMYCLEVITITQVDKYLKVVPTRAEAIAAITE